MQKATIFNIQRFSTEDGPGIRTTVFFKGCPLKCTWCHNPEGIFPTPQLVWYATRCIAACDCLKACPENALTLLPKGMKIDRELCKSCGNCAEDCPAAALELIGKQWSMDELYDEASRDVSFYTDSGGGITLSGGEPMMQHEFATSFMSRCRDAKIHVALDTTAYASPEIFSKCISNADMVLLDLKHMDPDKHMTLTGVPLSPILENAKRLGTETDKTVWVRTPIIPGATDSEENIRAIARFISKNLPNCQRYDLLPFSNLCTSKYERLEMTFPFKDTPLINESEMMALKTTAESEGLALVHASGMTALKDKNK